MPSNQIVDNNGSGTAYDFLTLAGEIEPMGQNVEEITRANVDGQSYRRTGKRGDPFEMIGVVDCLDSADAANLYIDLKALQGTVVKVYDAHGNSAEDTIVLKVMRPNTRKIAGSTGGLVSNSTYLLTVRFMMAVAHPTP